jgi:hypothetical protein
MMGFFSVFALIQVLALIVLFVMVVYALWLAIKALQIYIRKNSY